MPAPPPQPPHSPGPPAAPGTRPAGVAAEEAPRYVRSLFDRIAPRYDRANHLLSLSTDRYWRWRTARTVEAMLEDGAALTRHGKRLLDLCCGTGDLALALAARQRGWQVHGSDFTHRMLVLARDKARRKSGRQAERGAAAAEIPWIEADAMRTPFADGFADAVTTAFGFRNLADYRAALAEFHRLLKPGGVLAILEFSEPSLPLLSTLYGWYFHRLLPWLGGWISGSGEPYRYLPGSVDRFPQPPVLAAWMEQAGFAQVRYRRFTGGIAVLHTARKPGR